MFRIRPMTMQACCRGGAAGLGRIRATTISARLVLSVGLFCGAPAVSGAAESLRPVEELSLDDLLNLRTEVATQEAVRLRDAPGNITVLTREEILALGVRDLLDLMELVPGFTGQLDVSGVVGLGYRGMWGHEGKILLLWDGLPLNERAYTTFALGNRFPIDQIDRVEIIRGPGSVTYGGFAELAVINVVPVGAADLAGGRAAVTYGQLERTYGRRNLSLQAGRTWDEASLTLAGYVGQSVAGNRSYTTFYDESYRLGAKNTRRDPLMLRAHGTWRGLTVRYLFEDYRTVTRAPYGDELSPAPLTTSFLGHYLSASYAIALADNAVQVVPFVTASWSKPWRQTGELDLDEYPSASYSFYDTSFLWGAVGLRGTWNAAPWLKLKAGVEGQWDGAWVDDPGNIETSFDGEDQVAHNNLAAYGEVFANTPVAEITVGGRFEHHSSFGPSFVPRLSLTKQLGDLHWKVQVARSFRSPGIEQINGGLREVPTELSEPEAGIDAERTETMEIEVGYRVTSFLHLELVGFSTIMKDPVVYGFDPNLELEYYVNGPQTGSRGLEAALKLRGRHGWATASYSVFTTRGINQVETYVVPDHPDALVGMPNHKVALSGKLVLLPGLSVAPSAVFLSGRYAFAGVDAEDATYLGRQRASWRLNLFVAYSPPQWNNLTVGVGAYDLLDQKADVLQPYDGYHAPFPSSGREYLARVTYAVAFD